MVECILPERIWDEVGLVATGQRVSIVPGCSKVMMECTPGVVELLSGFIGTTIFRATHTPEPVLGKAILLSLGIELADDGTLKKLPAIRMPGIRLPTDPSPT